MRKSFFVVALLMSMVCIALCSCKAEHAPYERVDMSGLENFQGDISHLCYTDEERAIFTSGTKKDVPEGPLVDTKCITIYDLENQKIRKTFNISEENYIYNVVPYMDGILYASYDFNAKNDLYEWKLSYRDENDKKILDKGTCSNYDRIPQIVLINETPVYIFENIVANNGSAAAYTCGVKIIRGMQIGLIMETDEFELLQTTLDSNGREYFFLAEKDGKLRCYIGDLESVDESFDIDGKLGSFSINNSYVAVSIEKAGSTEENPEYHLLTFNLRTRKLKKYNTEEILYRLSGGSGENCMCVDWTFAPYKVNLENGKVEKMSLPKGIEEGTAVSFFPLNETSYLVEFMLEGNDVAYYRVAIDE